MTSKDVDFNILVSILIVAVIVFSWLIGGSVIGEVINKKPGIGTDNPLGSNNPTSTSTTTTTTITTTTIKQVTTTITTPTTTTTTTTTTTAVKCHLNSDCGENGTRIIKEYTCHNGDIYRQYISYRCSKPGTLFAKCVGREKTELIRECEVDEHCIEGGALCEYLGDVEVERMPNIPGDSITFEISNEYNNTHKGYIFTVLYVVSKNSKPDGIAVDIQKPDGGRVRKYCTYGGNIRVGNLVIGLTDVVKWRSGIWAGIWVLEKN